MHHRIRSSSIALALLGLVAAAGADDVKVFSPNERVDPAEVARILERPAPRLGKWRSLRLIDDSAADRPANAQLPQPAAAAGEGVGATAALSLPVQFRFDSAEILPEARQQLDAVAAGIQLLPAHQAVVIEGHTDSTGSDDYNETLSQRRAHAVRRYLVATHGIAPQRLRAQGLGETMPLDGTQPHDPSNRRVQFRGK